MAIFADALISGVNVSATYGGTVRLVGDNFDSLADTDHVILVADVCVDGYRFSHWENLDGESLGTANSIRLTKAQVMDNVITAVFVLDDGTYKDNVNLDKNV